MFSLPVIHVSKTEALRAYMTGKPTTNVALVCGLSKVLWRSMLSGNRLSWSGSAGPFGCAQPREVSSDRGLPRHLAGDMPW